MAKIPLHERYPELAAIPRVPLASLPTPLERCSQLSREFGCEIWCKRDDRTATSYGGNKVRKLEYLLGDARTRRCDTLLTVGALGSHHVLATAIHGAEQGFEVHAVLVPQPWNEHVEENLRADLAAGATLHGAAGVASAAMTALSVRARLKRDGRRPYLIGPGGSSSMGCLGYLQAGAELGHQILTGEMPRPDAIVVAIGSGATAVGLALGLRAVECPVPLVAVRVTGRSAINRAVLRVLADRTERLARRWCPGLPRLSRAALAELTLDHSQFGPGYGHGTAAGEEALRLGRQDGIVLDPTYTAKAFATVVERARAGSACLVFVQTLGSVARSLDDAPPAPDWARALSARAT